MLNTNANTKLYIATTPQTVENLGYKELEFFTDLKTNYSVKKIDRNYYHNGGDTTSLATGRTISLSVVLDFDNNNDLHNYLVDLAMGDVKNFNNQRILMTLPTLKNTDKTKVWIIEGVASIQFKNFVPTGAVDELQKLEFDIFPQDNNWVKSLKDIATLITPPVAESVSETTPETETSSG